jgi:hypothetical protein
MTPIAKNPPVGALGVYWARVYAASPQEVAAIEAIGDVIGAAIAGMSADKG